MATVERGRGETHGGERREVAAEGERRGGLKKGGAEGRGRE